MRVRGQFVVLYGVGAVFFAAKPRDYSLKINKKMYRRALRSIFSELYRRGDLIVVSEFKKHLPPRLKIFFP